MLRNLSSLFYICLVVTALTGCALPRTTPPPSPVPTVAEATIDNPPTATIPAPTSAPTYPVPNTLYLGVFDGQDAIFITNSELQKYGPVDAEKSSPSIGDLILVGSEAHHQQSFDFKDLQKPQPLFSPGDQNFDVANFILDATREELFVSLVTGATNQIYKVVLASHDYQVVWTNEIRNGSRYGKFKGIASLSQAKGDYLVMGIGPCYGCEFSTPADSIVLNVSTRAELVLGSVGNISLDLDVGKVSFQHLVEVKATCEPSPGCNDDGFTTLYEPSGDGVEKKLP